MDISNILTKEQREAGLTLEEDVFEVTLRQGDRVVAMFGHHAEIAHIRAAADMALHIIHNAEEWTKSGISFEQRGEGK